MFPLFTGTFPSSVSELERRLNESLQRVFLTEADPVTVRGHSYPHLDAISISLDGGLLRTDPPQPPVVAGKTSPALEVDQFTLTASPLTLGPAVVDLSLSAHKVRLCQGRSDEDQIVLALESASDGKIEIATTPTDLEALIAKLAQNQAGKQGVTIDGVQLKLRQKSDRSVAVEIHLRARKIFLRASICVTGQFDLDDQLNLKTSGLNCSGDGGMATLACGILKPYLQKIDGREFSLMSLPLGNIRLRNVRLTAGEKICVTAEFDSAV